MLRERRRSKTEARATISNTADSTSLSGLEGKELGQFLALFFFAGAQKFDRIQPAVVELRGCHRACPLRNNMGGRAIPSKARNYTIS